MRRVLLTLSFWLLALGFVNAQEAFYIYRNDGDFHGFFYDEVVEMRYSKLALDSVEYEQYVTYEVELADTTYRIPLAAIDSIGFQQPEIKLNPKVRFMERDGLIPYFIEVCASYSYGQTAYICLDFTDMPANMAPQVDDVIIGLPTDVIADEKYHVGDLEGSFGCVVESVEQSANGDYRVHGRPITEVGQVFEQYITIEQIGVDENNQIHRRVAGCTPDGFPRKMKNIEGEGELNLINFSGTVNKDFEVTDNSKLDIQADIEFKLKLRVAYNITGGWIPRFYAKMTRDMSIRVKPSVGVSISGSFHGTVGDVIPIPSIMFPPAAPVFQTRPYPDVFLKVSGGIDARLNLPQVYMGVGEDVIYDSDELFPIGYSLHLVPDEKKDIPTDEMLDASAQLKFSGSVQTGIEFQANISTADWFRKVLNGEIALHLYCGPKISGDLVVGGISQEDYFDHIAANDPYKNLNNSQVNVSLLALDFEAGATAGLMWDDPEEVTFYSKSWAFLTDTLHFAPGFDKTTIDTTGGKVEIHIHPTEDKFLLSTNMEIGIVKFGGYQGEGELVKTLGGWTLYNFSGYKDDIAYTLSEQEIKELGANKYYALPIVTCGPFPPYRVTGAAEQFVPPVQLEMDNDNLEFAGAAGSKGSVTFTTNCPKDDIFAICSNSSWVKFDSLQVLDSVAGRYKAIFKAKYNTTLFDRSLEKGHQYAPILYVGSKRVELSVHQTGSDLAYVSVQAGAYFDWSSEKDGHHTPGVGFNGAVLATRQGNDVILFEGTTHEYLPNGDGVTSTMPRTMDKSISFTIQRTNAKNAKGEWILEAKNGTIHSRTEDSRSSGYNDVYEGTMTFTSISSADDYRAQYLSGSLSSGTYNSNGIHMDLESGAENNVSLTITVNAPGEE